jgi:hypothetical protein
MSISALATENPQVDIENFNFGITHFDNIGAAMLSVFQCVTLEGWVLVMYMLQDSFNDYFASIFFLLLILFGSFFLLNVTLAIVFNAFEEAETTRKLELVQQTEAFSDSDDSDLYSDDDSEIDSECDSITSDYVQNFVNDEELFEAIASAKGKKPIMKKNGEYETEQERKDRRTIEKRNARIMRKKSMLIDRTERAKQEEEKKADIDEKMRAKVIQNLQ